MPRNIHIASRVDTKELLSNPERILQTMSLKIFERREQMIESLLDTRVTYLDGTNRSHTAIVEKIEHNHAHLRDNYHVIKVPISRIVLE